MHKKSFLHPLFGLIPLFALIYMSRGSLWHLGDFYPLYFGAQRLIAGESPYGKEATSALVQLWDAPFAQAGIAYPLPVLFLIVPLTVLAFPLAALLWTTTGALLSYSCVIISRQFSALQGYPAWFRTASLLLPLAYWPLYTSMVLDQATLIWFGLAIVLVLAILREKGWLVAICIVLLVLKPQSGMVFAAYGAYWLWRNQKQWILLTALFGGILLAVSLAIQPLWIPDWLAQVNAYSEIVKPQTLMPVALIVLIVVWRLRIPGWAKVAIVQVILFPISDLYSTLPLLLAWCAVAPPLALFGAGITWLLVLFQVKYYSMTTIWLLMMAPLMAALLWETRPPQLRRRPVAQFSSAQSPTHL